MSMWDERDDELKIRERLAALVAEKISGVEGARPEAYDYVIADVLGEKMMQEIGEYLK